MIHVARGHRGVRDHRRTLEPGGLFVLDAHDDRTGRLEKDRRRADRHVPR